VNVQKEKVAVRLSLHGKLHAEVNDVEVVKEVTQFLIHK